MDTFLFSEVIFGPVKSRRLGISLGINLSPLNFKYCNFDCLYCECGWTLKKLPPNINFISADAFFSLLENKLKELIKNSIIPDCITFAGNGEPTLHPEFPLIIEHTVSLRNKYIPGKKIAVLSNSSTLSNDDIVKALLKVDVNMLKLDVGLEESLRLINRASESINLPDIINNLKKFKGKLIIQSLFIKGTHNDKIVDNTTDKEIKEWISLLKEISPEEVVIYSISRNTALDTIYKVSNEILMNIADRVSKEGLKVSVF
ncbi:MAG: radical SAM protein [Bacteroidales bacterium]|nr:radical SAM protein [Bacteroidales bacterium]